MEGTIGEIRLFAGNFAPRNWAFCQGQLLSIAQNTALFSILGTTYGGNGQTTFALPNLASRMALGAGQGPGLNPVDLGEMAGSETHTLLLSQMPMHTHGATGTVNAFAGEGNQATPANAFPAKSGQGDADYHTGTPNAQMASLAASVTVQAAGSSQPVDHMPPYLGLNYIICMFGIFPSRN
jgi:microcystin-dependent protein